MTITEVMKAATEEQRNKILNAIVQDGWSLSAAYSFCNGRRRPRRFYQGSLCLHIKRYTGVTYTPAELFG